MEQLRIVIGLNLIQSVKYQGSCHLTKDALVLRCSCDILPLFVLRPKIQLRFRAIFLKLLLPPSNNQFTWTILLETVLFI